MLFVSFIKHCCKVRAGIIVLVFLFFCIIKCSYSYGKPNDALCVISTVKYGVDSRYSYVFFEDSCFNDTVFQSDDSMLYNIDDIRWGSIIFSDSLKKDFYKLLNFSKKPVKLVEFETLLNNIVRQKVDNGYPFFSISTKTIFKDSATVDLAISANGYEQQVVIDTVVIPQNSKIKQKYINRYLKLQKGDFFNYSLINAANDKLARLPFVTLKSPLFLRFSANGAVVEIPVEGKTIASAGGIIGFATNEVSGKLLLTGDFNLKLVNALKNGEMLNIVWKSPGEASQILFAEAEIPFIFNTPLGFYANVDMNKQDSTFLNVNSNIAAVLYFNGINQLQIGTDFLSNSFLANKDSSVFDTKSLLYKGRLIINNTNDMIFPDKGYVFDFNLGIGNRKTLDTLSLSSTLFRANGSVTGYVSLFKRVSLMGDIALGALFSESILWNNEMFILGGTNSVRGFDEMSIFATRYSYATVECRYLLDNKSYALLFSQVGYTFLNSIEQKYESMLFSVGLGGRIDTGAGMFVLLYALGQSEQQPMKFKNSKIHFGYVIEF